MTFLIKINTFVSAFYYLLLNVTVIDKCVLKALSVFLWKNNWKKKWTLLDMTKLTINLCYSKNIIKMFEMDLKQEETYKPEVFNCWRIIETFNKYLLLSRKEW